MTATHTVRVREYEDVNLPCIAVGRPQPIVTWERPGGVVSRKNKRYQQLRAPLYLNNVKRSDAGVYNCTARNKYGTSSTAITLRVLGKMITISRFLFIFHFLPQGVYSETCLRRTP